MWSRRISHGCSPVDSLAVRERRENDIAEEMLAIISSRA